MIKFKIILTFIAFCIGLNAFTQEMSFEAYNPKSTLIVPENPTPRAKFTFIDVHSHQFRMAEQDLSLLIKDMDKLNEGIMVNLSGGSGEGLRAMLKNVNDHYPNRFVIFANVDFSGVGNEDWGKKAAAQLGANIKAGAKGLKIYKSLGLRYKDVNGNRIRIDDSRLDPIWEKCSEMGVPVLIHAADPKSFWDDMNNENERWLELKTRPRRKRSATNPAPWQQIIDEQHRIFKKHAKTKFINAHMGWYANDLKTLSKLLDEMPNMSVGIGAIIAELGRQPIQAKAFL